MALQVAPVLTTKAASTSNSTSTTAEGA